MGNFRYLVMAAASTLLLSCSHSARIEGVVEGCPQHALVVKALDVNVYRTIDTVVTDGAGRFACKVAAEKGQPEFVYIFRDDVKIASAVVLPGDRISISADTLGRYSVSGSEESELLHEVETEYSAFLDGVAVTLSSLPEGAVADSSVSRRLSAQYLGYYRKALTYIMKHPYSITSVAVCFQTVSEDFPVFNTTTDAIRFRALTDSLVTVYPESKYVKALSRETERREKLMAMEANIRAAQSGGFPEIVLGDMQGRKSSLSEVDARVILLHFWTSGDAAQKMFNQEVLKPAYAKYHDKGFEIYAVALDADKSSWAGVVKAQQLPWVNVCDTRGAASPYIATYNVSSLPLSYVIFDGEVTADRISDSRSLEAFLAKKLK